MNNDEEIKETLKQIAEENTKEETSKKKEKTLIQKWWFWAIVVIIIFALTCSSGKNTNTTTSLNNTNRISNNTTSTNTKIERTKVTVADFSQMTKEEIQNWCYTNKIICTITGVYSDTITKGEFVSQSVEANSTVYEGDKITVSYSLGKEPTTGQKNALKEAKSYLAYTAFSYSGLIKQLEYEGYSNEEATYGVDNCGADWNEQATKMAKSYMEYSSFSRSGLIKQLEYEGFTNTQAEYGVSAVGY